MGAPLPHLELISHHLCPYVQRAVITLLEKEIPHDRTYIDLAYKPDWFLQISPFGKVPLLKVGDTVLFESVVICEYLDEITPGSLLPADPLEKAKHRAWIEFGSGILNTISGLYNATDKEQFEQKRQDILDRLTRIEANGIGKPYFAGELFFLVDAVYAPIFRYFDVFEDALRFNFFSSTPNVKRWWQALHGRRSVQSAVTEDYDQRLLAFLKQRHSYLSTLISQ
jgi:glutathione S-transferase